MRNQTLYGVGLDALGTFFHPFQEIVEQIQVVGLNLLVRHLFSDPNYSHMPAPPVIDNCLSALIRWDYYDYYSRN